VAPRKLLVQIAPLACQPVTEQIGTDALDLSVA
jgi:hypothetical protein